jgi:hypothetical protein
MVEGNTVIDRHVGIVLELLTGLLTLLSLSRGRLLATDVLNSSQNPESHGSGLHRTGCG